MDNRFDISYPYHCRKVSWSAWDVKRHQATSVAESPANRALLACMWYHLRSDSAFHHNLRCWLSNWIFAGHQVWRQEHMRRDRLAWSAVTGLRITWKFLPSHVSFLMIPMSQISESPTQSMDRGLKPWSSICLSTDRLLSLLCDSKVSLLFHSPTNRGLSNRSASTAPIQQILLACLPLARSILELHLLFWPKSSLRVARNERSINAVMATVITAHLLRPNFHFTSPSLSRTLPSLPFLKHLCATIKCYVTTPILWSSSRKLVSSCLRLCLFAT